MHCLLNALVGFRTANGRRIQQWTIYLDAPLVDEGGSLVDIIPDTRAEQAQEDVIQRLYTQKLHEDLERCIERLRPVQQAAVRERYFEGRFNKEASCLVYAALERMRRNDCRNILKEYEQDIISRYGYRSSVGLWKETGYSSTEYTAMKLMG